MRGAKNVRVIVSQQVLQHPTQISTHGNWILRSQASPWFVVVGSAKMGRRDAAGGPRKVGRLGQVFETFPCLLEESTAVFVRHVSTPLQRYDKGGK